MRSMVGLALGVALLVCVASVAEAQPGGRQGGRQGGFGGGFGGQGQGAGLLALLRIEAVQKELGLSEDQIASIRKVGEELRPARGEGRPGGRGEGRPGRGEGRPGGEGQPRRRGRGNDSPDARANGSERFFVQQEGQPGRRQISEEDRARMREEAEARAKKEREEVAKILKPEQLKRLDEIRIQQAGVGALNFPDVAEKLKISDEQKEKMGKVREESQAQMRELFTGARDGDREAARAKMTEMRTQTEEKVLAVLNADQKKQFEDMKGAKFDMPENAGRGPGGRGPGGAGGRGPGGGARPQN